MKKFLGVISFALIILVICFFTANITQVIDPGVTTFRVLMICGIIISFSFSFLSEKGLWRKLALGLSICWFRLLYCHRINENSIPG
ncbi:hypothetical protein OKW24_003198 [Peribacillus simplex]|uniref:hypothetical protein n=1 Tax=Peribacillus simplex TaxID=1478 RepID=UPI0024E23FB0|nr:hypothetical protein [Peribacillus simplex]MDF9761425.1 hypothetical protein [Peribacillus simplex]